MPALPSLAKLDQALLGAMRVGIAMLLLTPLVVTSTTVFPFVVGKALYSRVLIEIVFMLWVLLALRTPAYRSPRSWLLGLLAAGLGAAFLAAAFGVSWQRSLWSNYERMQGLADLAHGFALALVLASMLRKSGELRLFLNLNLVAGMIAALVAIGRFHEAEMPFYGILEEMPHPTVPRVGASFGNAVFLGAYMLINMLVALGFLAQSFASAPSARPSVGQAGRRHRQAPSPGKPKEGRMKLWLARLFWVAAVLIDFWALNLSGTRGVLLGLVAAVGSLGLLFAFLAHSRLLRILAGVWTGLVGLGSLGLVALYLGWVSLPVEFSSPLLKRVVEASQFPRSMLQRQASWEAGLKAFPERPLFGWGPDNYVIAFGRYAEGFGATIEVHDRAHSDVVEEVVTKGLLGLLTYLALWGRIFQVLLRGARRLDSREQILILFISAALIGDFIQGQVLFDSHSNTVQSLLLFAFAVYVEAQVPARQPRRLRLPPRVAEVWKALVLRGGAPRAPRLKALVLRGIVRRVPRGSGRIAIGLGAVLLSGSGLFTSQAIYAAAQSTGLGLYFWGNRSPQLSIRHFDQSMTEFGPLANFPRRLSFRILRDYWKFLRSQDYLAARRMLDKAEAEGVAALEAEPENWQIHKDLANLYRTVAATEPSYRAAAAHHAQRALELAPER